MRKILLKSQGELIKIKKEELAQKEQELNKMINLVAMEFGIPEKELNQWKLSDDNKFLEPIAKIKKPKETIPSKKKKK